MVLEMILVVLGVVLVVLELVLMWSLRVLQPRRLLPSRGVWLPLAPLAPTLSQGTV